eukprot:gene10964-biopygen5595
MGCIWEARGEQPVGCSRFAARLRAPLARGRRAADARGSGGLGLACLATPLAPAVRAFSAVLGLACSPLANGLFGPNGMLTTLLFIAQYPCVLFKSPLSA